MTPHEPPVTGWRYLVFALPLLVIAAPIILAYSLWDDYRSGVLRREFLRRRPGKRGIVVYSNSPNWQRYIEANWLPTISHAVVVLNWSERATWDRHHAFEQKIFRRFAGDREFNPLAIIFKPRRRLATLSAWLDGIRRLDPLGMFAPTAADTEVVRFFQAFRDYKHGKHELLRARERQMFGALGAASSGKGNDDGPVAGTW